MNATFESLKVDGMAHVKAKNALIMTNGTFGADTTVEAATIETATPIKVFTLFLLPKNPHIDNAK